ncbi:MAG: Lrp/AsnC family transcriptional regulator [Lachnospiraceae bacterium]|nr:Lrp/AsnC family transcriptional regulator [Lachnospiraceae bacterium]
MDQLDYQILKLLKENGRESASNISKKVRLSVSAVLDRIKKLEENGAIKCYTIIVDEKAMGNDMTAIMEISLENPKYYDSFTEAICRFDNVVDCYYMTGDFDFILKISCSCTEELDRMHRLIKNIQGVAATRTHFVLRQVKNIYSTIPLPNEK